MRWDLVVVGAGAAGLLAAARAAERGKKTLLLEKNRRPGVKILMSGGTRCNLTQATDNQGIIAAFGPGGRFLHSALASLSPQDLVKLFEVEGVPTKVEETGKIFPQSDQAADVLDALLRRLDRSKAELSTEEPLTELTRTEDGFCLTTSRRVLTTAKVLLTTGGQSYPGSGTTGDGYRWAGSLGHTIVPPRPALVPVTSNAPWVAALRGVTVPDVLVKVIDPEVARPLAERRGSFLFTHFGLSGPAVLDVSRAITGHPQPQSLVLTCDFLPEVKADVLDEQLRQDAAAAGKKKLANLLPRELPHRLAQACLELAELDPTSRAAELPRAGRRRLVESIKALRIPVSGTRGFKKAEVTAGGVSLAEVDSRTLQSKLVPGLYLAGEILDLDGYIGGYNFQAAFSTGWLAAESV